jgi:hypothetical protein
LSEVADVPISKKSTEAIMAGSGRSSNFIVEMIRRPMREDEHLGSCVSLAILMERALLRKIEQTWRAYKWGFQQRQAARMRLPVWLALLMPLMVISCAAAIVICSIAVSVALHRSLHPGVTLSEGTIGLVMIASLIGLYPPALMLLNMLLHSIPALRRILDENSKGVPGASYRKSMDQLRKVAIILTPPALLVTLIGAIEPWAF